MRISLLLAFSLSSFTFAAESAAPKKPNILIIVADDLGYADTGFNGSNIVCNTQATVLVTVPVDFDF